MNSRDIIAACQRQLPAHANDCSGFVRAVAPECGVLMFGNANDIVDLLRAAGRVLADGVEAAQAAAAGDLVIGGVKAPAPHHGHVVVVVGGPLNRRKYPYCFWGQYHAITLLGETVNVGFTRGHGTLNWAFGPASRDSVVYAAYTVSPLLSRRATGSEGFLVHAFT